MDDRLRLLHEIADAVAAAFREVRDFGPSGQREGQYALDLVADEAAVGVIRRGGLGVLSEESGWQPGVGVDAIVVDPIDGSTNASRGVPWFATSLCWVGADGAQAALVANQATGERWWAVRGAGAWRGDGALLGGGSELRPSGCRDLGDALIGLNALPSRPFAARQSRIFGAVALDLCQVAAGTLDGYVDFDVEAHGPWDYMAGALIVQEAGGAVADLHGRELMVLEHAARRTPVAAATPELLAALLAARAE